MTISVERSSRRPQDSVEVHYTRNPDGSSNSAEQQIEGIHAARAELQKILTENPETSVHLLYVEDEHHSIPLNAGKIALQEFRALVQFVNNHSGGKIILVSTSPIASVAKMLISATGYSIDKYSTLDKAYETLG
jgi:hypothetical protein